MVMFLYHYLWTIALLFLAPVVGLLTIGSKENKDHSDLKRRLRARMAWRLPDGSLDKRGIWVHALSVGEVISALPLVEGLAREYPGREIVFTASTAAGLAVAKEKLGFSVRLIFPMPVDAWWAMKKVIDFVRPSVFILVETDIWPGLLGFLRRKGVPSLLVNGRVSPRTFKAYRRAPCVIRKLFEPLCACLMQSDLDRQRLLMSGIERSRVITTGNIKFDRQKDAMGDEERHNWLHTLGLEPEVRLWVAGSTHPGEEDIILDVFKSVSGRFPGLRLIIAPRDPGRASDIVTLAGERGLRAVLKTRVAVGRSSERDRGYDLLVLDTLGELGRIYGLGSVCFVGGSLVPVGGHNLLEPASFGMPVLFGPHTHNFVSMATGLLEEGGGRRVRSAQELERTLECLLKDEGMRTQIGTRARTFVEKNRGALDRVLFHVGRCMGREGA